MSRWWCSCSLSRSRSRTPCLVSWYSLVALCVKCNSVWCVRKYKEERRKRSSLQALALYFMMIPSKRLLNH